MTDRKAKTTEAWMQDEDARRRRWYENAAASNGIPKGLVNVVWFIASRATPPIRKIMRMPAVETESPVGPNPPSRPPITTTPPPPGFDPKDLPPFPRTFLWGAATAAFQVEGCIDNSDWSVFSSDRDIHRRVAAISSQVGEPSLLAPPGTAVHHADLEVLKQDLDRCVLLGINAYRFSIEWSRVMPDGTGTPNAAALAYYSAAIDAMLERGIEPLVTLNHVTLPLWILTPPTASGPLGIPVPPWMAPFVALLPNTAVEDPDFLDSLRGWENPVTVDHFIAYVNAVLASGIMDRVTHWITLNEPTSSGAIGYLGGIWPPGFSLQGDRARTAYLNMLKAHSRAFRAIKNAYSAAGLQDPQVGLAQAIVHFSLSSEASAVPGGVRDGIQAGAVVGAIVGGVLGVLIGLGLGGILLATVGPAAVIVAPIVTGIAGAITGAIVGAIIGGLVGAIRAHFINPHEEARRQADYFYNFHLIDSLTSGKVDIGFKYKESERTNQDATAFFEMGPNATFMPQLDFIGVNYYRNASVHHSEVFDFFAPYTGGALFGNDLRNTRDVPFLFEGYRNEEHGILNDMGWDVFPKGLRIMLERLAPYGLPVIITENGHAESNDRNRAPHLLAHLQQMGLAAASGVDVKGYCHWSIVDNFEWAEHYNARARFGLFEVVRTDDEALLECEGSPGRSFPRRITEGAIALQYFIANNAVSSTPFRTAIERFGVMSPDGKAIEPPTHQAGALWDAIVDEGSGRQSPFRLYLSQLEGGQFVGMLFDSAVSNQWKRLSRIVVSAPPMPGARVTLSFEHASLVTVLPGRPPIPGTVTYTASTTMPVAPGAFAPLTGSVVRGLLTRTWNATRDMTVGLWESTGAAKPKLLAIRNWEGEAWSPPHAKYLMNTPEWQPGTESTKWTGTALSITRVRPFETSDARLSSLTATLAGTTLTGRANLVNQVSFTWTATRIAEDVGF